MRVVYITRPDFLDPALCLTRELSKLVELHLVVELTPESWGNGILESQDVGLPSGVSPGIPVLSRLLPKEVHSYWEGAASVTVTVHNNKRSLGLKTWSENRDLMRFVRRLRPDVVHLEEVTLRDLWRTRLARDSRLVLSIHDPQPHSEEKSWRNGLPRRHIFPRTSRFIVHSESLVADFCDTYDLPAKSIGVAHLAPYEVFSDWPRAELDEVPGFVLFFGRLTEYKGLGILYQALQQLSDGQVAVRLVVAGEAMAGYVPPPVPRLSHGSVRQIEGHIPTSLAASLFERAAVVVLPYLEATQSGVALTAFALGKPVVASRVGGLPEYILDGVDGLLVPPGDAVQLADALRRVVTDSELSGRLTEGASETAAKRLTWVNAAQAVERVYRDSLSTNDGLLV